jgi:hypothetical protein
MIHVASFFHRDLTLHRNYYRVFDQGCGGDRIVGVRYRLLVPAQGMATQAGFRGDVSSTHPGRSCFPKRGAILRFRRLVRRQSECWPGLSYGGYEDLM